MIGLAGRDMIDHLQRADFNNAVALTGVEARGFGIEDNFTHQVRPFRSRLR